MFSEFRSANLNLMNFSILIFVVLSRCVQFFRLGLISLMSPLTKRGKKKPSPVSRLLLGCWDSSVLIFNYCQMDGKSSERKRKRGLKHGLAGRFVQDDRLVRFAATATGGGDITHSWAPRRWGHGWMFEPRSGFPVINLHLEPKS